MRIVGKTADDPLVVDGIFHLYDTNGLPLDVVFHALRDSGYMPSWLHFYADALSAGWKPSTVMARLRDAITDTWGQDFATAVIGRLEACTA